MAEFDRGGSKSREFFKSVNSNTTEWDDVVIPSGELWFVRGADGFGLDTDGSNVAVVWDRDGTPKTLFIMYGTGSAAIEQTLEGDGIKKLSIRLQNRTLLNGVDLLCRYHAEKL